MPDEVDNTMTPTTTEEKPAAVVETLPVAEPAAEVAPAVAATPDWLTEIDKADPKILRSNNKIAGLIGNEVQKAVKQERDRILAEEGQKAAREAEENLRKLAQEDPVTFAERWLSDSQKQEIQSQLSQVQGRAKHEIATSIGRSFQDMPEWKELTTEDHEKLASSLIGKPDDEVIPLFNRNVLELIADRRAQRLLKDWQTKEMEKAREAIRQEEAAKLLKAGESPDIVPPKGLPAKMAIPKDDAEFEKFWHEKILGR